MQIKRENYSIIALCVAVFINGILIISEAAGDKSPVPLLMLLLLSEVGFIVSLFGVYYGAKLLATVFSIKQLAVVAGCLVLGLMLGYKGYMFWQSLGL